MGSMIDIVSVDQDRRIVHGWAYTVRDREGSVVVDKSGDFVDDELQLENAAYNYVVGSRRGGFEHMPGVTVGTLVESVVFTAEKLTAMGIDPGAVPHAWWVGFYIADDTVWEAVKSGRLRGFSIHGSGKRHKVQEDI